MPRAKRIRSVKIQSVDGKTTYTRYKDGSASVKVKGNDAQRLFNLLEISCGAKKTKKAGQ